MLQLALEPLSYSISTLCIVLHLNMGVRQLALYVVFQLQINLFLAYWPSSVQFRKFQVEASAMH